MKEVREELAKLKEEREITEKQRKELEDLEVIIKEGRILSTKNRTLVKDIMDKLGELKEKLEDLYNATEPPAKEEVEKDEKQYVAVEDTGETKESNTTPEQIGELIDVAVTKALTKENFIEAVNEGIRIGVNKKLGKVE